MEALAVTQPEPLKAGIYFETAEEYHSTAGFISSSPLPALELSAGHFKQKHNNGIEPTPEMDRGTFLHSLCLEQDIERFVARPVDDKGNLVRSNSAAYKEFLANNEGKTPIKPDLFEGAYDVLNSICQNKFYLKVFNESKPEVSFYGVHPETGLPIKARLDFSLAALVQAAVEGNTTKIHELIMAGGLYIRDLKSVGQIDRVNDQIFKMGYVLRLVHYAETVRAAIKHMTQIDIGRITNLGFIFIEQSAPYATRNFRIKLQDVDNAYRKHELYMNKIKVCMLDNSWPMFDTDTEELAEEPRYMQNDEEVSFGGGFNG